MVIRNPNDRNTRKFVEPEHRINGRITARDIRLIDEEGNQCGIVSKNEALMRAEDLELDLVEISPNAVPPVCKIMDYSKFTYEKKKKEKLNKQNSKISELKEITIRPVIDKHDFETKLKHCREFLEKGNKVKIVLKLKGRERQHTDKNLEILKNFVDGVIDVGKLEQGLTSQGAISMVILQPIQIKKD